MMNIIYYKVKVHKPDGKETWEECNHVVPGNKPITEPQLAISMREMREEWGLSTKGSSIILCNIINVRGD